MQSVTAQPVFVFTHFFLQSRYPEEQSLEASVYAHGLHGAGFHDVVQGHIPSHQGSLKIFVPNLLGGKAEITMALNLKPPSERITVTLCTKEIQFYDIWPAILYKLTKPSAIMIEELTRAVEWRL